ncbi:MAG: hypothetical protein HYY06_11265 [Deltaproteobacteria bacterium]|nr:hypothetical protein [Deltaproteobacteria bacterium]
MTALLPILPGQVELCWFQGQGYEVRYGVRVVFERCGKDVVADALARIEVRW